jgi:hypothetical protein
MVVIHLPQSLKLHHNKIYQISRSLAIINVKKIKYMAKTSRKAGKAASKVLRNGSTGKNSKTAAGSALRQRRDRK